MTHEKLSEMIQQATHDVFSTMLGIEVENGEPFIDEAAPSPAEGLLALVGLAGGWAGTGTIACSSSLARHLSSQLLMQDFQHVDEEVLDAMAEVANMIIGNVKTLIEDEIGPMGLSIPTVIYGRNFTARSVARSQWTVVPFRCGEETLHVHMCLVPSKETSVTHRHSAVLSLDNS